MPSLQPGDPGTPCPGSGSGTHSWELRMESCGACQLLREASGHCCVFLLSSPKALPAQAQETHGQERQECWHADEDETAQSGEQELGITLSKGDSFSPGLCLGVSDPVTECYSWQPLSTSPRSLFWGLSVPGVAGSSKSSNPEPRGILTHTLQIQDKTQCHTGAAHR